MKSPATRSLRGPEPLEPRIAPATFAVTSLADAGPGSLRQAVLDANAAPGADTIKFDPSLSGEIGLTSGELLVTGPLKIKGPAAKTILLDANGASRIFQINDGDANLSSPVEISNLSMTRGSSTGSGGGIFSAEPLALINSSITGSSSAFFGGGLYLDTPGKATIKNAVIAGNSATGGGGGIYARAGAGLQIFASTVTGNSTVGEFGGGRLWAAPGDAGKIVVDRSVFSNNESGEEAGGLGIDAQNPAVPHAVKASFFASNRAGGDGGGLHLVAGAFAIDKSTFLGNEITASGHDGAGFYAGTGVNKLAIKGSAFLGNFGAQSGGGAGIFNVDTPVALSGSVFSANSAVSGGGLRISGDEAGYAISKTQFFGNEASQRGGGLYGNATGQVAAIKSSSFASNMAAGNGGGIYSVDDDLLVEKTVFTGNRSDADGGGIANGTSPAVDLVVKSSTFAGNTAGSGGGAVAFGGDGTIRVEKSSFVGNSAEQGGALQIVFKSSADLVGNILTGNTAAQIGGGIFFVPAAASAVANVIGSKILNNAALDPFGGGGGLYFSGPAMTIDLAKSIVSGNSSGGQGGGLFVSVGLTAVLNGAAVVKNTAPTSADIAGASAP